MEKSIGTTIASLRIQAGLTQSQLAAKIGRTQKAIRNIEDGNCDPSADTIIRLAQFFHISADSILGLSDQHSINLSMLSEKERGFILFLIQKYIHDFHSK